MPAVTQGVWIDRLYRSDRTSPQNRSGCLRGSGTLSGCCCPVDLDAVLTARPDHSAELNDGGAALGELLVDQPREFRRSLRSGTGASRTEGLVLLEDAIGGILCRVDLIGDGGEGRFDCGRIVDEFHADGSFRGRVEVSEERSCH